jgi:beta-galactosidase
LKDLGEKDVRLNGRTALILPFNVKLANGWILEFSTCQVFYSYDLNGRTILIVYGDLGSRHEVTLTHPLSGARETVNFRIYEDDFFKLIGGVSQLLLVALSRERAARTWFVEHLGKRITVVSSLDLLRGYSSEDHSLSMNVDFKKGDGRLIRVIVPWRPKAVRINGKRVEGTYDDEKWLLSLVIPDLEFKEDVLSLEDDWKYAAEDLEHVKLGNWVRAQGLLPPESLGMIGNGHIWYFNKFVFNKAGEGKITLFIPRVNDYVSVFLNGRFLGYAKHVVRLEIDEKLLKNGENELLLLVESTGHRNDGILPVANGLNEPVFIGKEATITLKNPFFKILKNELFLKPGVPAALDYSKLVNKPMEVLPSECFSGGWMELKSPESLMGERGIFLLKYVATLPKEDKKVCVVLPPGISGWGRLMLFVNGSHAGTVPVDEGEVGMDVTRLVKRGEENEFIFLLENVPSAPVWNNPCIRLYDTILDDGWSISQGLLGEKEGWFKTGFDDSHWSLGRLSEALNKDGIIWLRRKFFYKLREDAVSPLMLRLNSVGTKCKIYLNGELIGRFLKNGPQKDFYMPEPFLKEENLITIAVENYEDSRETPSIQIIPYYLAKKTELEIGF